MSLPEMAAQSANLLATTFFSVYLIPVAIVLDVLRLWLCMLTGNFVRYHSLAT